MYAGGIVGVEKRTNICSALCVHFHSQSVVTRLLFEIQSMPTDSILWLLLCAWCSARFIAAIFLVHTMLFLILTNPLRFSTILLLFISKSYIVQTSLFIILTLIPSRSVNRTMGKPPFIYLNEIVCFSAYPFTFVRSFTHSLSHQFDSFHFHARSLRFLWPILSFIFSSNVVVCRYFISWWLLSNWLFFDWCAHFRLWKAAEIENEWKWWRTLNLKCIFLH